MDRGAFFDSEFDAHEEAARATRVLKAEFLRLAEVAVACLRAGGKILFFGNGGSAADAQHLAAELVVRYTRARAALPAIALTCDTSILTAAGNDLGYERVFARQLEALGRAGDLAIGISTSGNSPNVLGALEAARARDLTAAALSGQGGGKLKGLADPLLVVPSDNVARIQEMHILLGHMLCDVVERECPRP